MSTGMIVGVSVGGVGLALVALGLLMWAVGRTDRDRFAAGLVVGLGRFAALLGACVSAVGGVVCAVAHWVG